MRAIIIGAGRGRRLMPTTADTPKCYAEIHGRRMLDWALRAFAGAEISDFCFIGGYQIDKVRRDYPQFTFRHNDAWENNNILLSLMYAEDLMAEGFVCCYSDILFTSDVVRRVVDHPADIALSVDTRWLERYTHRTQHPPDDAEKVTVLNGCVTRIHRGIVPREAHGEYTGIAKFTPRGAAQLREHFHQARERFSGQPYREAAVFERAYLIHLLQDMIEAGAKMAHADTPGQYMEVDTQQDFELARQYWQGERIRQPA
ncbi:MAG: phosphocholine cytidylyltransferase family protein [Verrucomicrobia bacterium]|nr:phosphocholine cytidylyltransferase family protein [Verrucomicrobiota bacterium]